MDPFIGQVILFAGNFAPRGWAFCDGALQIISANTALYSIIGTTYGGDGTSNFALPDLRSRVPMGVGTVGGLTARTLGEIGGAETHGLTEAELPAHGHPFLAGAGPGTQPFGGGATLGSFGTAAPPTGPYSTDAPSVPMATGSVGNTGSGSPHNIVQPFLGLNYIIATVGIYPSHS